MNTRILKQKRFSFSKRNLSGFLSPPYSLCLTFTTAGSLYWNRVIRFGRESERETADVLSSTRAQAFY